jgi:mRNA interferase MazF
MDRTPNRGEVWYANLGETVGHEQGGTRPALIISTSRFNRGASRLVIVVPFTSTIRDHPLRITVTPPEAGLRIRCQIQTDQLRAIAMDRLDRKLGKVRELTLALVENRVRDILDLF